MMHYSEYGAPKYILIWRISEPNLANRSPVTPNLANIGALHFYAILEVNKQCHVTKLCLSTFNINSQSCLYEHYLMLMNLLVINLKIGCEIRSEKSGVSVSEPNLANRS